MRGILPGICIALAACDDAVVLEVHPAPGIPTDSVQLFIGLGTCDHCPGIQTPTSEIVLPGDVLYREDSNRKTSIRTARVEDGVARFRIEASEVGDTFSLAVAVDTAGRSAALIRSLPLDNAGRYRVDLIAANQSGASLGPKLATASGQFVEIWQHQNSPVPCMGFEHWSDGKLGGRVFIVPKTDLDCDAQPADECAPYGYTATGVPAFADATCTTSENLDGVCWLGGPACDELSGAEITCAPTDYCLPSSFCDEINATCRLDDLDGCLFSTMTSAKLKCSIAFQPASDGTHASPCDSGFEFSLFPPTTTNQLECVSPPDGKHLFERSETPPPTFDDSVTLVTQDATGKMFPLDVRLRYAFNGCTHKLELSGDKALGAASAPMDRRVFAQFWTTRNGGSVRKLLVPVEMVFTNDCSTDSTCVLLTDSSLTSCVR